MNKDKVKYNSNDVMLFLDRIQWALEDDLTNKAYRIILQYKDRLVKERDGKNG